MEATAILQVLVTVLGTVATLTGVIVNSRKNRILLESAVAQLAKEQAETEKRVEKIEDKVGKHGEDIAAIWSAIKSKS